jgi:hypothetical protein
VQKGPPTASAEAGLNGIQITLSAQPEKKIPAGYGELTISAPIQVQGALKPKGLPVSASAEKKSDKSTTTKYSVEVYKADATTAGTSKFKDLVAKNVGSGDGFQVEKVEWEGEEGRDAEGAHSIATGVKISWRNGQTSSVKASLFETSAGAGMSGPKVEIQHEITLAKETLWENQYAELTVEGKVAVKAELTPDWKKIFLELAKSGGRAVARNFARAALRGMASFLVGPGAFVAGGIVTVFAFTKSIIANAAIKEMDQKAHSAVDGYVNGWKASWGIDGGTDGEDQFFYKGIEDGRARLLEQVKTIQQHPVFAPWEFTEDEVRIALKSQLRDKGGEVDSLVRGQVQTPIFTDFVLQFYANGKADWSTPNYIARNDARWLARRLGLDPSIVPDD